MNTTLKLQRLWEYCGIQDDEILIVRTHNQEAGKDEYLISEKGPDGLKVTASDDLPELSADRPFHMIQQRNSEGKYVIPSVEQLIQDKIDDY